MSGLESLGLLASLSCGEVDLSNHFGGTLCEALVKAFLFGSLSFRILFTLPRFSFPWIAFSARFEHPNGLYMFLFFPGLEAFERSRSQGGRLKSESGLGPLGGTFSRGYLFRVAFGPRVTR